MISKRPFGIRLTLMVLAMLSLLPLVGTALTAVAVGEIVFAGVQDYEFIAVVVAAALWPFTTAIGLARALPWSRVSILILAAALAILAAAGLTNDLLARQRGAQVSAVMAAFYFAFLALGAHWLIYFCRRTTVAYFRKSAA